MAINYTTLKTEITTDPKGYGYAASWTSGDDVTTANLLNQVRSTEQIAQSTLSWNALLAAIVPSEFQTIMSASESTLGQLRDWYLNALGLAAHVDLSNGNIQAALSLIFPSASCPNTYAAIQALYTRNGSRAETLFGAGTVIQPSDIGIARQS